jgi:putative ABC transport system permease protein
VCLAVTAAFTLLGLLLGLHTTYRRLVESSRPDTLYVNVRFATTPMGIEMPIAMRDEIAHIPGVAAVAARDRLSGYYQDPHNVMRIAAVDHGAPGLAYSPVTPGQWQQLFANPAGVLVSRNAAQRWHLKVGDRLPLITPPGTRADGAPAWQFQVTGIVSDGSSGPNGFILANYDYVDKARSPQVQGRAIEFEVAVTDPARITDVSLAIDDKFANSGSPTLSIPDRLAEENVQQSGISAARMIWPVSGAGIFMILLVTANGIAQSVRTRVPELAVLSAAGYQNRTLCGLVLAEAAVPCVIGALLGTGLAKALTVWPAKYLPEDLQGVPAPTLSLSVAAWALGLALLVALASAVPPVLRLRRLSVVDALAGR